MFYEGSEVERWEIWGRIEERVGEEWKFMIINRSMSSIDVLYMVGNIRVFNR